jgi:anhydro-N-acetylmuramic acid kinase
METIAQLSKVKNKRYLILSAGGPYSSIQGIYSALEGNAWSILSHALLPYPAHLQPVIEKIMLNPQTPVDLTEIGRLDHGVSHLFLECAKTVCAGAQKSLQAPHVIVLNKLGIRKELLSQTMQARYWNIELGDAQLLASCFKAPVVTDFIRHDILGGGPGDLPLGAGMRALAIDKEGIAAHLTVGTVSHLFIFDSHAQHIVIDADIGPGTGLMNKAAKDAACAEGFDRDGSFAAQGRVDPRCLETLATHPLFSIHQPGRLSAMELLPLADHPCLASLSPPDKLATLTALTARTVFDFYKKEYAHVVAPQTLWISGGGANNQTLFDFLTTYFAPLQLRRIDDIGIPAEMFVPMVMGCAVDAFISGRGGPWKAGNNPEIEGIGTWVYP